MTEHEAADYWRNLYHNERDRAHIAEQALTRARWIYGVIILALVALAVLL